MRKNISKVLDAFKEGKSAKGDSKESCSTNGIGIYSYTTLIALRLSDFLGRPRMWLSSKTYSRTTSAQQSAIRLFARMNGYELLESESVPI